MAVKVIFITATSAGTFTIPADWSSTNTIEVLGVGAEGCLIHDRAPSVRRDFDCRDAYRKNASVNWSPTKQAMVNRGRELIRTGQ